VSLFLIEATIAVLRTHLNLSVFFCHDVCIGKYCFCQFE